MELDIIKTQTTWNDAAAAINSNNLKIGQRIEQLSQQGSIDPAGTYPDMTVGKAEIADKATVAEDLQGRLEATPEEFTYRASAGDKSIKDDTAYIRRIKGNSIVWNQLADSLNTERWYIGEEYATAEYGNNYVKLTATSDNQAVNGMGLVCTYPLSQAIAGHSYIMSVEIKPSKDMLCGFRNFADTWTGNNISLQANVWTTISYIVACTSAATRYPYVGSSLGSQVVTGDTIEIRNPMIFDLTLMFGTGYEPSTVEEFRALYPDSYYPYNDGELRNLNCNGLKTVGFNQWNGSTLIGYIRDTDGTLVANTDYLSTDYIRVIPNESYYVNSSKYTQWGAWYDKNKQFISGIIGYWPLITAPANAAFARFTIKSASGGNPNTTCINLSHTGYRDGEYEPYKEVTHSLPLAQITNGKPLRSAGSIYDEINETEYIKRVGVVDLGSLAWGVVTDSMNGLTTFYATRPTDCVNDFTSSEIANILCNKYAADSWGNIWAGTSDKAIGISYSYIRLADSSFTDATALKKSLSGVKLNYELLEPIVSDITTSIDLSYYVEDFGSEEAILAENSAPFSADIIYQFNATDRIRQNDININRLNGKIKDITKTISNLSAKTPISNETNSYQVVPYTYTVFTTAYELSSEEDCVIELISPDSEVGIDEITDLVEYQFMFDTTTTDYVDFVTFRLGGRGRVFWGDIDNTVAPYHRYIVKVITDDGANYYVTQMLRYALTQDISNE